MTKKSTPRTIPLFFIIVLLILISFTGSCTKDEYLSPVTSPEKNIVKEEVKGTTTIYKGIFATQNSSFRGVFKLSLPKGKTDLSTFNPEAKGSITLQTGEIFEAKAKELLEKTADFRVLFESDDLTFKFGLDENNKPLLTDVVFQNQEASIIAAAHTAENPVTPITGTYQCTNCENQNTSVSGIELNNNERIFNMLLTTADGSTSLSIQAVVGILVDTQLVINETCTTYGSDTFCLIKGGSNLTSEPVNWAGVHRYPTTRNEADGCSGISGNFDYTSVDLGSIQGVFKSDISCPTSTYFISPTGNDNATGLSPLDPWKSISKVNNIILNPGDEVLFEGGYEYSGNLFLDSEDANDHLKPVKIASYGTGKATIKAGNSFGIFAYNTAGISIDNLIVAGSGMTTNTDSGIVFYNDMTNNLKLDGIRVTNSEVYGFKKSGIEVSAWSYGSVNNNSGYKNVLIENNKVHDILDRGITSFGNFSPSKTGYAHSNVVVRSCEVYNIKGYSKGEHSGNGIILSDVQNSVIEYCTAYNSGSGNTHSNGGPVGIWYWDADNVIIQYNEVYGMKSGTKDGGGFDLDGGVTNGIMQYNYSHDNYGAGYLIGQFGGARPMDNIIVRYNISENDAATNGGSVYLFNGGSTSAMKNIDVYNNTFFISKNSSAAIKILDWQPITNNINFSNNILSAKNGAKLISVPAGYIASFKGNLYDASENFHISYQDISYSSLAAFQGIGQETLDQIPVGYEGDAKLTNAGFGGTIGYKNSLSSLNAYLLQADSPAIDAGILLSSDIGTRDFYGSNLSQGITKDIGAHENLVSSSKSRSAVAAK